MKKRILVIPLALVLALSLVTMGCPAPVVEVVYVVPPVEPIYWAGQSIDAAGVPRFKILTEVMERIAEATGGRLVPTIHPAGAIVPAWECYLAVDKGILDFSIGGSLVWLPHMPNAVPFTVVVDGLTSMEQFFWMKIGDGMDLMQAMIDDSPLDFKAIGLIQGPAEIFLYTTFPIYGPECLVGRKLRLVGDEAVIFDKLGVISIGLPGGEVYEAMRLGMIEGFQHVGLGTDWVVGLHEVTDYAYISPVRMGADPHSIIVNWDSWNALPPDIQIIVQDVMWAAGLEVMAYLAYLDTIALDKWVDFGVTVRHLPVSVEIALIDAAEAFYAVREAECADFAEIMRSIREWRDAFRKTHPRL